MDFKNYLKLAVDEINQELDSFFKDWLKEVKKVSPALLPLAQVFADHCSGGKRLRGALVKLGYHLPGVRAHLEGDKNKEILKVSAAMEIFQTAILAHDDIIDESPLRRGKPTIYKELGGDHYAISQTIALADIGFFLAVRLISESNFPPDLKNKTIVFFAQSVINTGLGELLDVKGDKDVLTIHKLKTSYYTIINPLQLGIILGGGDKKLLDAIEKFGVNLGIAFQIQDDILGVFGDEKILGKSVTSDIEEGKNTLLITEALKKANSKQKKILDKYYGKKIDKKGLEEVRKVFIDTGSLNYSQEKAKEYVKRAKKYIPTKLLKDMADFLVERQS